MFYWSETNQIIIDTLKMIRNIMNYTEDEIIKMCDNALEDIATFYRKDFINYRGKSSDTKRYYTEIVAECILNHLNFFKNNIPVINRQSCYNLDHNGYYREETGRVEEVIAIKMFNRSAKDGYCYKGIGKIIDYQTPLKSKRTDVAGKVDLLAYDGNVLRILELKKPSSEETMLRCVLEGYTYLCTADKKKLLCDFALPQDTEVRASPFVFMNGEQWKEWNEGRPMLFRLMLELDIKPYFIQEKDEKYEVMEA